MVQKKLKFTYKKMKYIKLFENTNWNKVLHSATWGRPKNSEDNYDLDFDNIKLAVENGADVDFCNTLSWAIRNDNYEVIKFMLENGADVNFQDNDSPLMLACSEGQVDIAKLLIDYGADPTIGNFQDFTTFDILNIPVSTNKKDGNWIAKFNWSRTTTEIKEKRNEIFKYLSQQKKDITDYYNPELAYENFKDFSDEQKEKFGTYIASKKYNL